MGETLAATPELEPKQGKKILVLDADQVQGGLSVMALKYGTMFGFTGPGSSNKELAEAFGQSVMDFGLQEIDETEGRPSRIFAKSQDEFGQKWVYLLGDKRFKVPDATFHDVLTGNLPIAETVKTHIQQLLEDENKQQAQQRRFDENSNVFEAVRSIIRQHPQLHENLTMIPGVVEAKNTLFNELGYVDGGSLTARIKTDEMEHATERWFQKKKLIPDASADSDLESHSPKHVEIVKSPKDKLLRIVQKFLVEDDNGTLKLKNNSNTLVLIDDSIGELTQAFIDIQQSDVDEVIKQALTHIVVAGYGADTKKAKKQQSLLDALYGDQPGNKPHIVALPNWKKESLVKMNEEIETLIT